MQSYFVVSNRGWLSIKLFRK